MADDRPQYQHGLGTIGGQSFHWGSGTPGKYWSVPYGDYPVTPDAPTGDWAHRVGAIPIANNVISDPLLGRNRIGIMIHSGSASNLDALYTQGCFKVAPSEWPAVRSEILKEASNGPLYLHVAPGGVAAFTNTKTFSQASSDTPAANANATANTAAAPASSSSSSSFFGALHQIESGGKNIYSTVDKDYPGQPGSRSQGYDQIDTPTWQTFAAKAGIDTTKYPNAMSAPVDVQDQVASLIPLSRFGARTQRMLGQQFGQLDTSKTIGELAQGTTLTSTPTPPHTLTPATAGAPYTPAAVAAANPPAAAPTAAPPQNVGDWLKQAATRPQPKTDDKGNEVQQKSPLEKLAGDFAGDKQQAPSIPEMPQAAPVSDPNAGLAPAAQQLFQTVSANAARPLSWSARPYGYNAGFQGTTLNQTGYGGNYG